MTKNDLIEYGTLQECIAFNLVYTNACNISAQLMIQCLSLSDNVSLLGTSMNIEDSIV